MAGLLAFVAVILLISGVSLWQVRKQTFIHGLVEQVLTVETSAVADLVEQLRPYRDFGNPLLVSALEQARADGDHHRQLHASLALQVAAVWTRDTRDWQIAYDLTAEQVLAADQGHRQQGFIPVDVCGYVGLDEAGQPADLFAAIWGESAGEEGEFEFFTSAPNDSAPTRQAQRLGDVGFDRLTLHSFIGHDGDEHWSSVWSKQDDQDQSTSRLFFNNESLFFGEVFPGLQITDLNVIHSAITPGSEEQYRELLSFAESQLEDGAGDASLWLEIVTLRLRLKRNERALDDLNALITKWPNDSTWYLYRAIVHARGKRRDDVKQDMVKFAELNHDASYQAYLDAVVSAHLGEDTDGMMRLESAISQSAGDVDMRYNAACAYSVASSVVAGEDVAKSEAYAARAINLLQELVVQGYDKQQVARDMDLDPLHEHSGFKELIAQDPRIAAVWSASAAFESTESHGLGPDAHLQRSHEMAAAGYRPAAISVSATNDGNSLVTASAWYRPLIPDAAHELLAKQQSNAAVALLRMGQGDEVWPLLKHSPDPRRRSYLIHRFGPLGASPQAIVRQLEVEPDVSVRRALILTLGEFDDRQLLIAQQESITMMLLDIYANDPDAGIHAASEWVLRRWGQSAGLKEIDATLVTGELKRGRQWYVNQQGQTLVVIPGPVQFVMGTPFDEADRQSGQPFKLEVQHRKRIDRSFAIMTHEVTVEQFRRFQKDHRYSKEHSRTPDNPVNSVTWYAAAEYCNWLSKQEGIPEDQWCYVPNGANMYEDGMYPATDYLQRRGYRLPTESEWEYACRSGAKTSRCYGDSNELLGQYAWYAMNSLSRGTLPVASLKPNDLGLFDMHGNAMEWCHGVLKHYRVSSTGGWSDDLPDVSPASTSLMRIVRGGSFQNLPENVRSAKRNAYQPPSRISSFGLRAVKTCP